MAREMKESGLDWLQFIPERWTVKRNKALFFEVNDRCEDGDKYTLLSVSEYSGVTPRSSIIKEGDFETHAESLDGYKICKPGDIVMNIMLAWKRATAASSYEGIVSPAYCVFRCRHGINARYYHYLFRTDICADMFKRYSTGIIDSRLRLYPPMFLSLKSPVPPIDEQRRIADFLDAKCALIDDITEKTRVSIEEYKKLKQSMITQAVTKGIRTGRPMKASGIDWIGEIPEDWQIIKIKAIVNAIESGVSVNAAQFSADNDSIGVLKTSCVSKFYFIPSENKAVNQEDVSRVSCPVKANTIIMSRMNTPELVGACGYVDRNYPNLFLPDRLWQISFNEETNVKYLWYFLNSKQVRNYYGSLAVGTSSSMQNISQDQFYHTYATFPEKKEQDEIVFYLDQKCAEIDRLVESKKQLITELGAYKKSLIYEYVTGKKEVPAA